MPNFNQISIVDFSKKNINSEEAHNLLKKKGTVVTPEMIKDAKKKEEEEQQIRNGLKKYN